MSMSTGTDSSDSTMSEINVTPMVDVMLVLLIIFMVTAPLMQQGVEVDLPQTHAQVIKNEKDQPIILSIDKDKKIYIGKTQVLRKELEAKLEHNEKLKKDKTIDLQADRSLDYGFVVDIMAVLRRVGIDQVGRLTEPPPPDRE